MSFSHNAIIYTIVLALSVLTFYGFLKIGVEKIARSVPAKPVAFIVLSLIGVGLLGIGIKNLAFETDFKMLLPEKVPARIVLNKINEAFGGIDPMFV